MDFAVDALADSYNSITLLELIGTFCRTTFYELDDFCVFVFGGQLCANSLQRERKTHIEVFRISWRKIRGVWIDCRGYFRQVSLKHIFAVGLENLAELVAITLAEFFNDFLFIIAGQSKAKHAIFNTLAPDLIELGSSRGEWLVLSIEQQILIDSEIHLRYGVLNSVDRVNQSFNNALMVEIVYFEPRLDIARR